VEKLNFNGGGEECDRNSNQQHDVHENKERLNNIFSRASESLY